MTTDLRSDDLSRAPLGKQTESPTHYQPQLLFPIARANNRARLGISPDQPLPFYGVDVWQHYEVSWLNAKGKPQVAMMQIRYDCNSPYLIESKSLKLYFNSLNDVRFANSQILMDTIQGDLSRAVQSNVTVQWQSPASLSPPIWSSLPGRSIDDCDIRVDQYLPHPDYLVTNNQRVHDTLHSHLFKSNCPVTGQPDWASILIKYIGLQINDDGLLRYLVSYRHHAEFHEQCIERIFMDIQHRCQPEMLIVQGFYTRRGGIDINPCRSSHHNDALFTNLRLARQ